jgi:arabinoxylan arabinofuranohydrolase
MAWSEGVKSDKNDKKGVFVTQIDNNDYIEVKAVNFEKNAKKIQISAASITGGKIEIHLDDKEGKLIGVCNIESTGDVNTWKEFNAKVEKVNGLHNVFFVFKGNEKSMFNLDWWTFK